MNILYITGSSPLETSSGSSQRSHLLWKALGRLGTVYTLVPTGPLDQRTDDEANHIHFASFFSTNRLIFLFERVVAKFGKGLDIPFRSEHFVRDRMRWPDVRFDLVVTRYLRNASVCSAWKIAPCYVDIDDWPIESFRTIHKPKCNFLVGVFFDWTYRVWTRYILRRVQAAWVPNAEQRTYVEKYCPCGILPNLPLAPKSIYHMNGRQQKRLMTIGLMSYEPNYEGVDWFLDTIWPVLHRRFPDLIYSIGGKGVPGSLAEKWRKIQGVELLGFVDDLDALYESALAVVTPVNSGAGTCIKVLEACQRGRFVLATPFSIRGLSAAACEKLRILVSQNEDDYVNQMKEILAYTQNERTAIQKEIAVAFEHILSVDMFNANVAKVIQDSTNVHGL